MYKTYKKIKIYKINEYFLRASVRVRVKALLPFDYFHDWNLSIYYRFSLIYISMFHLNIYKNFYIISDADNFKKLYLVIS